MPTINPHYSPLVPGANLASEREANSYNRPNAALNRQPPSPSVQTPLMHSSSPRRPSPTGSAPSSSHSSNRSAAPSTRPLVQTSNYGSSSSSLSSGRRYAPGGFTAAGQSGATATAMAAAARTQRDANGSAVSSLGSTDSMEKRLSGASEQYSSAAPMAFSAMPDWWGRPGTIEDDDYLHDPKVGKSPNSRGSIFTLRGLMNIGTVALLAAGLLMLFGGYPLMYHILQEQESNKGGFGLGGTNSSGQIPANFRGLIDPDTPRSAYRKRSLDGQRNMNLVFSDEFNVDGRSFYPGDDPFWEAVDLHYWGTGDYEWYDPSAVTTEGGNMVITMIEHAHRNMNFRSGMVQSWNKFCFTGGHIEFRVRLPGAHDIPGLWPAAWTMGNLGRAGHGASTEGALWPYTYDACDVGTLFNQTYPEGGPIAAATTGTYPEEYGGTLSYLPGQRLSRCTCPDYDDHPGPKHPDGSYVGRAAPEIDAIEAAAGQRPGVSGDVSMSLQLAPFDAGMNITTTGGAVEYHSQFSNGQNAYKGGVWQQCASSLITTPDDNYEDTGGAFDQYGFEYRPGYEQDGGFITWTAHGGRPMWTLRARALGANAQTEIAARPIPLEPMYIIMNLGMSEGFSPVDFDRLTFPAKYLIDYVRVWQDEGSENVGCSPDNMPTKDYIDRHIDVYTNPNLTTWTSPAARGGYNRPFPPNRLMGQC